MCGCKAHDNPFETCTCKCDHRRDVHQASKPKPNFGELMDDVNLSIAERQRLSELVLALVDCYNSIDEHISRKDVADKLRELADEYDHQPIVESQQ